MRWEASTLINVFGSQAQPGSRGGPRALVGAGDRTIYRTTSRRQSVDQEHAPRTRACRSSYVAWHRLSRRSTQCTGS